MIRDKADESYGKLPIYLHRIKEINPSLVTDCDGHFLYVYMVLASIHGLKHCKPIVVVDVTYITSAHKGTVITTCTVAVNEQIFPLVFAIINSENNLAYEWFFRNSKTPLENKKTCASY